MSVSLYGQPALRNRAMWQVGDSGKVGRFAAEDLFLLADLVHLDST